jgi:hypothetical protein
MYVTIGLNAYANGAGRRVVGRWLGAALAAWPLQALERRYGGAVARLLVGRDLARAMRARHSHHAPLPTA